MRSLYWKIFLSFWIATILIIFSTAWITSEIAKKSSMEEINWAGLTARLVIAIIISGLICYLLSIYLTKPLRTLRQAAKSLAKGKLNTRVHQFLGHKKDEIADLSYEFNSMAEKLQTLILAKERLLQDVSHELRSPLARLQVAIELARKKCKPQAESEFARMEIECLRLNTLIGETLQFARLDSTGSSLIKTNINLKTLLESIIEDANFEFSSENKRVKANLKPCAFSGDHRLIQRAVENIIRNALRYSEEQAAVAVDLYENEDKIFIDISDTGPGVPENQLKKIFDPFYRVDSAREKKTGGFGLGLAIARQAVQQHSGEIFAFNRPEQGLCVRIILPISV